MYFKLLNVYMLKQTNKRRLCYVEIIYIYLVCTEIFEIVQKVIKDFKNYFHEMACLLILASQAPKYC